MYVFVEFIDSYPEKQLDMGCDRLMVECFPRDIFELVKTIPIEMVENLVGVQFQNQQLVPDFLYHKFDHQCLFPIWLEVMYDSYGVLTMHLPSLILKI